MIFIIKELPFIDFCSPLISLGFEVYFNFYFFYEIFSDDNLFCVVGL